MSIYKIYFVFIKNSAGIKFFKKLPLEPIALLSPQKVHMCTSKSTSKVRGSLFPRTPTFWTEPIRKKGNSIKMGSPDMTTSKDMQGIPSFALQVNQTPVWEKKSWKKIKSDGSPVNHKDNLKPKETWGGHLFCGI